jgi:excisionase family DNA binding protein
MSIPSTWHSHHEMHGVRPFTISVATFRKLSGLGNTKTYELIADGTLETILVGRKRLISYRSVERLLLPAPASADTPKRRGRHSAALP